MDGRTGVDGGRIVPAAFPIDLPPLPDPARVTVVMSAYDYESFVGEAIASVLSDPDPMLDLLVVDDGSTDATASVAADALADDPRGRLVRQANAGQSAAFNRAVEESSGDIICFLDADDLMHVGKAAALAAAFRADHRAGFLVHLVDLIDGDGRAAGVFPPISPLPCGWYGDAVLGAGGFVPGLPPTAGIALRRELVPFLFPLDTTHKIAADYLIQYLAPLVTEISRIERSHATVRRHGSNATHADRMDRTAIDPFLERNRYAWQNQRAWLERWRPDVADRLRPLSSNRFHAELTYLRARLDGAADVAERHAELLASDGFGDQPTARRIVWQLAPRLPDAVLFRAADLMMNSAALRRVAQVARRAVASLPGRTP